MTGPNATTAALTTPGGMGGIAVIVVQGPDAGAVVRRVFRPHRRPLESLEPDRLCLGSLVDGGEVLDEALVTFTPAPDGTRAEINIHGGPRIAQRALLLLEREGAAVVEPDPLGPIDPDHWPLAAGGLNNPAIGRELLQRLPRAMTAGVVTCLTRQWSAGLSRLARDAMEDPGARAEDLAAAAERYEAMRVLLAVPEVVLAGPPNAGKSSLANALAGRAASIVTDQPGTTRDWVRTLADLGGPPVWLTDTAGLWAPDDPIDRLAVDRAWQRVDRADLVVAVFDASAPPAAEDPHWTRLLAERRVLVVAGKIDLAPAPPGVLGVSARDGQGLADLRRAICRRLGAGDLDGDAPAAFTERQAALLATAAIVARQGEAAQARALLTELLEGGEGSAAAVEQP
ncbi:MAG: GTP-binding protein [Planctomycetes bacterium]|nr:GTP-binding protein [Planctomycetota bacterium]